MNVECRRKEFGRFYKIDQAQRYHPSKFDSAESFDPESFDLGLTTEGLTTEGLTTEGLVAGCGSIFDILRFAFPRVLRSIDHVFSVIRLS